MTAQEEDRNVLLFVAGFVLLCLLPVVPAMIAATKQWLRDCWEAICS